MSGTWELFALTPSPLPPNFFYKKNFHGKSTVQLESERWAVHTPHQTQLEKKTPSPAHPQEKNKKEGPFTP